MAVKTFESIYSSLSAGEKQLIDNLFAKEPELKAGWLRQDDFSRRQNEFKSKETRLTELEAYEGQMKPWAEEAHTRIKRLEEAGVLDAEGNELWTSQKAELEKKLAAASIGGEVDPAELERRVQDIVKASGGGLSKEEMSALVRNEAKKLAEETFQEQWKTKETDFNTKTIPTVAGFAADVAVFATKYEKETGEAWTEEKSKELFELMGREQNFKALSIGEKMLEPVRQKKQAEAEVERRVQERLKAMAVPEGGDERFLPQNVNSQKGALQAMLERSAEGNDKPMDLDLIIKGQANKAADALRTEGKF